MMVWSIFQRFYSSSSPKNVHKTINNIQQIFNHLNKITNLQNSIQNPLQCSNILNSMKYMNSLGLTELGIGKDVPLHVFKEPVCMEICNTPKFSLAVFIVPEGCKLPIHDHPQMCVLCKLVTGSLFYRSFTLESNSTGEYLCNEVIKTQDDPTWVLTPENGNFHELIAQENCVLFDALLPPYQEPERCCSYYDAQPVEEGRWKLVKLEEEPDDLPYRFPYLGDRPM